MSTPSEHDPVSLNRQVAELETEVARLEVGRDALARSVGRLGRRQAYLRLARWIRSPKASMAAYPLVLFAIGPLALGVIAFVLLSLVFSSWSLALGGFLVMVVLNFVALASLLYRPADALLPAAITEVEARLRTESARLEETASAVAQFRERLAVLHEHRGALAKSDKLQRAMLLQRNWKSLRGGEWEDYVVEVCRTLGANVQRGDKSSTPPVVPEAPATGARGVIRQAPTTLYVTFSPRRLAVAAVSEVNPVHAAAVRQVVDELSKQGCDELGILTNARVTAGSKEYAKSRRCTLVGEEEFPDFVLGKLQL